MVSGATVTMSPTSPMSTGRPSTQAGRRSAVSVWASSPDMPTAKGPWALMAPTRSRCTCPVSTMRTTSMASGVVTRMPASKRTSRARRSSIELIWGPPPCTTTGCRPACHSSTTSWANDRRRAGSTRVLPPHLRTTVLPWSSSDHGTSRAGRSTGATTGRSTGCPTDCPRGVRRAAMGVLIPVPPPLMSCRRCSRARTRPSGRWSRSPPTPVRRAGPP